MIETAQILSVADEIAKQFKPERIILFGSYAYGTPNKDSDVDLLVVMPFEGRKSQQSITIRRAVRASFPMDLIPITPERLKYRLEIEDFFLKEIVEKGKVLELVRSNFSRVFKPTSTNTLRASLCRRKASIGESLTTKNPKTLSGQRRGENSYYALTLLCFSATLLRELAEIE